MTYPIILETSRSSWTWLPPGLFYACFFQEIGSRRLPFRRTRTTWVIPNVASRFSSRVARGGQPLATPTIRDDSCCSCSPGWGGADW